MNRADDAHDACCSLLQILAATWGGSCPKALGVSHKHVPDSAGEGLGPGLLGRRGRQIGAEGPRGVGGVSCLRMPFLASADFVDPGETLVIPYVHVCTDMLICSSMVYVCMYVGMYIYAHVCVHVYRWV